jgi:hypothetical protein
MADGPGEWVEKDAFVLPELPAALKVDPIVAALLHVMAFLELSGDGAVDPDAAIEAMEHVGRYLQQLPAGQVESLRDQLDRVGRYARKKKWKEEATEFVGEFLDNLGLGEQDEPDDEE